MLLMVVCLESGSAIVLIIMPSAVLCEIKCEILNLRLIFSLSVYKRKVMMIRVSESGLRTVLKSNVQLLC